MRKSLKETGRYEVSSEILAKINETFIGYYADETETAETIKKTFEKDGYLADTHTAVALCCAEKYMNERDGKAPVVAASTASPYKFAADVYKSLVGQRPVDELEALNMLSAHSATQVKPLPLLAFSSILPRSS